jgi:Common central domain of tyrosinase
MITRRQFAAAGVAAAAFPVFGRAATSGCPTGQEDFRPPYDQPIQPFPGAPGPRKPLASLPILERRLLSTFTPKQLLDLRAIYGEWAQRSVRSPGDTTGLAYQAKIHRYYCTTAGVHDTWAFLLWHRGFLYFHERILAAIAKKLGFADFRVPVWDWENLQTIPDAWADPNQFVCPYTPRRSQGNLRASVDRCALQAWLFADTFAEFAGTSATGGYVFQGVHSGVHADVAGAMADQDLSAADTSFYGHHANIDRYWDHWMRQNDPGAQDLAGFWDQSYYYIDETGATVCVYGDQLREIHNLGYSYVEPDVPLTGLIWSPAITEIFSVNSVTAILRTAVTAMNDTQRGMFTILALARKSLLKFSLADLLNLLPDDSVNLPLRLTIPKLPLPPEPGRYYLFALRSARITVNIAGFGMFSHTGMQPGGIVATGCLSEEALRLLVHPGVQLIYGSVDSGTVVGWQTIAVATWEFLSPAGLLTNISAVLP